MSRSRLTSLFLGEKLRNLWAFILIMIPNFISVLLEGASFAFILLAFSQFTEANTSVLDLKLPFVESILALFHFTTPLTAFVAWLLLAFLMQALRSAITFATSYMTSNLSLRIQTEIQTSIYQQIFRLSFPCINRYRLGDLAEYAKIPSTFIAPFMESLNRCVTTALMVLVALLLMIKISAPLTFITFGLFAVFSFAQKSIIKKILSNSSSLSEHMTDFGKLTIQSLEGLRLIHSFHRHDKVLKDVSSILKDISYTSKALYFWHSVIPSINEVIGVFSIGSVLVASLFVFDTHVVQGIPFLLTFLVLAYRASTRVQLTIAYVAGMAVYTGPIKRLKGILKDEDKEYLSTSGTVFDKFTKNIEFQSVTFRYAKDLNPALSDLSFKIPLGHSLAIVGPSGGGKTSILDLLIRLYEPTEGQILIDGQPLSEYEMASWRNALGVVSQDSFIFNDTVEENIRFGIETVSQEKVIEVAKMSGAHDFIMSMSHGYQTKLGERGYKLSGGELQRLSLARALLKDPQILILDEATSNLDSITEQYVQRALEQYSKNRTVVVIAHRLSTIIHSDQILYIEKGRIIEKGRHHELIAKDGKYAYLWKLQSQTVNETNNHVCPV